MGRGFGGGDGVRGFRRAGLGVGVGWQRGGAGMFSSNVYALAAVAWDGWEDRPTSGLGAACGVSRKKRGQIAPASRKESAFRRLLNNFGPDLRRFI